jgi:hypothetical protein
MPQYLPSRFAGVRSIPRTIGTRIGTCGPGDASRPGRSRACRSVPTRTATACAWSWILPAPGAGSYASRSTASAATGAWVASRSSAWRPGPNDRRQAGCSQGPGHRQTGTGWHHLPQGLRGALRATEEGHEQCQAHLAMACRHRDPRLPIARFAAVSGSCSRKQTSLFQ